MTIVPSLALSLADCSHIACQLRREALTMIAQAGSGHPGGSLSAAEIVTALFFKEMRGVTTLDPHRDRFVLSKGHAVPILYAAFSHLGWLPNEDLATLRQLGSRLQGHPDRVRLPQVEASTGSLGQGLSVAQGLALGLRLEGSPARVFCLLGDGELQEGQVWEAALSAPKWRLSSLCAIVDANGGQIDGPVEKVMPLEPLEEKWKAFGWKVLSVDGHSFPQLFEAFSIFRDHATEDPRPTLLIARTVKGKGVSFMEHQTAWHGAAPSPEELEKALQELHLT